MNFIDLKKFVKSKHFFGQKGKPDEPSVPYMDFLYIAQKKSIPGILKIGITGGDRQLGKSQDFIWSWELIKPKLMEDQIKHQLKLFLSSWIKDSARGKVKKNNTSGVDEIPPIYGGSNADYDGSPYEFTTEAFNKDIDIYLLIHLARLNILAVYAHVGLLPNDKKSSELYSLLSTPFEEIQQFAISVKSKNTFFLEKNKKNINILNSTVVERKIENDKIYYLFLANTEKPIENNEFQWVDIDVATAEDEIIELIKEYMIGRDAYYKDRILGPFKIVSFENNQWKIFSVKNKIQKNVNDKDIRIIQPRKKIHLDLEYKKIGMDMEVLDQYTRRDLADSDLTMSLEFVRTLEKNNKTYFQLKGKDDVFYLVDKDNLSQNEETNRLLEKLQILSVGGTVNDSNNSLSFDESSIVSSNNSLSFDDLSASNVNVYDDNSSDSLPPIEESGFYETARPMTIQQLNQSNDNKIEFGEELVGQYLIVRWGMEDKTFKFFRGKVIKYIGNKDSSKRKEKYMYSFDYSDDGSDIREVYLDPAYYKIGWDYLTL